MQLKINIASISSHFFSFNKNYFANIVFMSVSVWTFVFTPAILKLSRAQQRAIKGSGLYDQRPKSSESPCEKDEKHAVGHPSRLHLTIRELLLRTAQALHFQVDTCRMSGYFLCVIMPNTKWYLVIQRTETQTDGLKKLLNVCTSAASLPWLQSVMEQIGLSAPDAGVCLNR